MKNTSYLFLFLILNISVFAKEKNAELLFHQTLIKVEDGRLTKTIENKIIIHQRSGDELSDIEIFVSGLEHIKNIEGSLSSMSGEIIRNLKKKDIVSRSYYEDKAFFSDDSMIEFSLKHNEYPYIISYSYTLEAEEFIFVDYWLPLINRETPVVEAHLQLDVPKDYPFNYSAQYIQSFSIDSTEENYIYHWNVNYQDSLETEIYTPKYSDYYPKVIIVPESFIYEIEGSLTTWEDYGIWHSELLENLSDLPSSEKTKIIAMTEGLLEEREKIKILYQYLQKETRYVNISIDKGGLKSYPASYVCEKKYGDCKALSNYFKAVLEVIGVESYYTKVYAGDRIRPIDMDFPSQQFNHVILCVPQENDTIWLDCTSDGPFNYLGTFSQNRFAFIINGEQSAFVKTPQLEKENVLEYRKIHHQPSSKSQSESDVFLSFRGDEYEYLVYVLNKYDEQDKLDILKEKFVPDVFQSNTQISTHQNDELKEVTLKFKAKSNKIYRHYGENLILKIMPFEIPDFEKPRYRKLPVQINYPIYKIDTMTYLIPEAYSLSEKSKKVDIESEYGRYQQEINRDGGRMSVHKSFYLKSGNISIEEYPSFYQFINSVQKAQSKLNLVISKH